MKHLKLCFLAILVAGCAFSQGTSYYDYVRDLAASAYNYFWGVTPDPKAIEAKKPTENTPTATERGIFGGGLTTGALAAGAGLYSGAGTLGTGLYKGVGSVGNGLYNSAGTVGSGLYSGAGTVGSGLYRGAGAVGTGLYNGAGAVGTGLYNGASYVTSIGSQYTLSALASALSAVNPESLTKALGLPADFAKVLVEGSKALTENVNIYNILTKLILGSTGDSENGSVMNYATAAIFLQKLVDMVPQLKKTANGIQTVLHVMNKMKQLKDEGKSMDCNTLLLEGLDMYFTDVDAVFKRKLIDLSPKISSAAFGDTRAAVDVVAELADRETVVAALKGMGFKGQVELIQMLIGMVADTAQAVREQNAAAQNATT